MAPLTPQLWRLTMILGLAQLISGFSFHNCIADPHSNMKTFNCLNRKVRNISAMVKDLPMSAVNLTVSYSSVSHLHNGSFVHLGDLQFLSLIRNCIMVIDALAFQNLHQLRYLNMSFNNLSELNPFVFEDLHNLTVLALTKNRLKTLPDRIFSKTQQLQALYVRNNHLGNFTEIVRSVSLLKNLRILDLCSNDLTSLCHSNLFLPDSVRVLVLCRNKLKTLGSESSFLRSVDVLDLSKNFGLTAKAFQEVDLSNVKLLHLQDTHLNILEFLEISNINAGHVDFSGTNLKNSSLLQELCKVLQKKMKSVANLQLGYNGITDLSLSTLSSCPKIRGTLDLTRNRLKNLKYLTFLKNQSYLTNLKMEHNHFMSIPGCSNCSYSFYNLKQVSYRYNRIISVDSHAFKHMPNIQNLFLNINNIAYLHQKALKGLKELKVLQLDNNLLTDLYNTTFEDNCKLETLILRNNRISVIFRLTFSRLSRLNTLDLGGNKITHFDHSGFNGLTNLSKLYLDENYLKQIEPSFYQAFQGTLTVLDLARNNIRFFTDDSFSPFVNFSKLANLKLSSQRPYGLTILPRDLFRGLHSLKSLYLPNNRISRIPLDAFDDLVSLDFLTLDTCCVGMAPLQPGVFKKLKNLTKLAVENMGILHFSKEIFGDLSKLHTLQLNRNVMQSIPVEALQSLPRLRYLDIRNIPLSCTCKNSLLQNYTLSNPNLQVIHLFDFKCPQNEKFKFHNFDTKVCYIDLGKYMFFCTSAVIFLFTITPLLYVKLYWKLKYSYFVFRSWFSEHWNRLREKEENCEYDAFISYNFSDEGWVMNELLPNLEGKESLKLCLHHRDFELGRNIVDNIITSVYSSRKTICVVSRNFLQSEWCSLEIQLASYRLFDEHRDVLLLVFLEPISERQLSSYHRMRKVMLKKTYLQWPGSDCSDPEQAQRLFWNQLCRAIRAGSRRETERDDTAEDFAQESKNSENHKAFLTEGEHCLQP